MTNRQPNNTGPQPQQGGASPQIAATSASSGPAPAQPGVTSGSYTGAATTSMAQTSAALKMRLSGRATLASAFNAVAQGVNPRSGEQFEIPTRRTVHFNSGSFSEQKKLVKSITVGACRQWIKRGENLLASMDAVAREQMQGHLRALEKGFEEAQKTGSSRFASNDIERSKVIIPNDERQACWNACAAIHRRERELEGLCTAIEQSVCNVGEAADPVPYNHLHSFPVPRFPREIVLADGYIVRRDVMDAVRKALTALDQETVIDSSSGEKNNSALNEAFMRAHGNGDLFKNAEVNDKLTALGLLQGDDETMPVDIATVVRVSLTLSVDGIGIRPMEQIVHKFDAGPQ